MCVVCYNEVWKKEIIKLDATSHDTCKKCFLTYIKNEIDNSRVEKLCCPHCEIELKENWLHSLLTAKYYKKYKKFKRNIEVN